MTAVLSNQKIINEIRDIQDSFIKTRPKMEMSVFKPSRFGAYNLGDSRGGMMGSALLGCGSPAFQKHPLSYGNINGNTLHPDPLYSGVVYQKYKNTSGGALLEKSMPLTGESESDTDSENESDEGGDIMSESSEGEFSSDEEGELGGRHQSKVYKMTNKRMSPTIEGGSKAGDMAKQAGQAIYKVITSATAQGLAEGAIKTAIMGVLTSYYGPLGATVGAYGLNEAEKLRNKLSRGRGKVAGGSFVGKVKETAASVKRRLKATGDAIFRAVMSKEARLLGQVALMGLITSIIGHKLYEYNKEDLENFTKMIKSSTAGESFGQSAYNLFSKARHRPKAPPRNPLGEYIIPEHGEQFEEEWETKSDDPISRQLQQFHSPALSESQVLRDYDAMIEGIENKARANNVAIVQPTLQVEEEGNPFLNQLLMDLADYEEEPPKLGGEGLRKKKGGKIVKKSVVGLVGTKKGNRARGDIVAEVMKKKGLSLAQASKYVKEHQLY